MIGIFARTFVRDSAAAVAQAVAAAGFDLVQLNLSSFGLPTIPDERLLDATDLVAVRRAFADRGIAIWGVSVTYNAIHPDAGTRRRLTADACRFIARIPELGAPFATLCTGTRDPVNMWRVHPANTEPAAFDDLRATLDELVVAAGSAGVRLGIEPEAANVISDAASAARLLHEMAADARHLAIVLDPANLVDVAHAGQQREILGRAFETLAGSIACMQAKDVVTQGYAAAGVGLLDYELIFALRAALPIEVPVIAQDVAEDDAGRVRDMLTDLLARHPVHGRAA